MRIQEARSLNTVRNLFPTEIDELKPLLRTAYGAIRDYQTERVSAREGTMRQAIRAIMPILAIIKPHIPLYKQKYIELLANDSQLQPYDLIVCFDRAIYELHARVKCGEWAHLPWSKELRDLLDERQQVDARTSTAPREAFLASGTAVTRGAAVGRARIVISKQDLSKVEQGDILVTPMTEPEVIHVAKLIAGFVTDRGGVLCHAALLARELNIPCIVGCQNATQVIQDGQWIRLDALSGIVMGFDQ